MRKVSQKNPNKIASLTCRNALNTDFNDLILT